MRVAIIGSGLTGLVAAWSLAPAADVTIFEASPHLGGAEASLRLPAALGGARLDAPHLAVPEALGPRWAALHAALGLDIAWSEGTLHLVDEARGEALSLARVGGIAALRLRLTGHLGEQRAVAAAIRRLGEPALAGASLHWHLLGDGREVEPIERWLLPWLPSLAGRPSQPVHQIPAAAVRPIPGLGRHGWTRLGHSALLEALAIAADVRGLQFGTRVEAIHTDARATVLRLSGTLHPARFDAAVLAPTIGPRAGSRLSVTPRDPAAAAHPPRRTTLRWHGERLRIHRALPHDRVLTADLSGAAAADGMLATLEIPCSPPLPTLRTAPDSAHRLVIATAGPGPAWEAAVRAGLRAAQSHAPGAARTLPGFGRRSVA